MGFTKITEEDLNDIGVIGLPDTPNLSTADMQKKFEQTAREVIIPKLNDVIEELNGTGVADSSKVTNPVTQSKETFQAAFQSLKAYTDESVSSERKTASDELIRHTENKENPHEVTAEQVDAYTKQVVDDKLYDKVDKVEGKGLSTNDYDNSEKEKLADANSKKHEHRNKSVLDSITDTLLSSLNRISTIFSTITGVTASVVNDDTVIPTSGAIVDYVTGLGGGDMTKAEYDADGDGVVDDSEKLGGNLPEYYADAFSVRVAHDLIGELQNIVSELQNNIGNMLLLETNSKIIVDAINELKANLTNFSASNVTFSPGESTLVSNNVESALQELDEKAENLDSSLENIINNNLDGIKMKIISIQNDKINTTYTIDAGINGVIIGCSSLSMMGSSVEEGVKVKFNSSNNIILTKPNASYGGDGNLFKFILFYAQN